MRQRESLCSAVWLTNLFGGLLNGREMQTKISLDDVKAKLKGHGYGGLYCPGECGCTLDDLAPCGECTQEDNEDYINGCDPGYVFYKQDSSALNFWMVRGTNQEPSREEWVQLERQIG